MTLLVFSAMKDEGPDVLEWVCYHRVVGFDEVLVYTNDCSDGSDVLLDALQSVGLVHHRRHSTKDQDLPALEAAAPLIFSDPVYGEADWAMWIDADEFFLPLAMDGSPALVQTLCKHGADAMALPWKNFGSSGQTCIQDGLVIDSFNMTSSETTRMERTFKCLFRTSAPIERLFVHRPIWSTGEDVTFVGPDLTPLPDELFSKMKGNGRPDELLPRSFKKRAGVARINHYPIKSFQQFMLKRSRKSGMGNIGRFSDGYLDRFNHNEVERTEIHRFAMPVRDMMAQALSHPTVRKAYDDAVGLRNEKVSRIDPATLPWSH